MSASRRLIIAIDGPAGSGKSTIAARLARKLGYVNLESGAMYRALALKAMEQRVPLDDAEALRRLAGELGDASSSRSGERKSRAARRRDISERIREADVTAAASRVSVHPAVRKVMVARQRELGAGGRRGHGRPRYRHGSLSRREVKIFLDADPGVRAERRVLQNGSQSADEAGAFRPRSPPATSATARAQRRRWCPRPTRSLSIPRRRASMKWWRKWREL